MISFPFAAALDIWTSIPFSLLPQQITLLRHQVLNFCFILSIFLFSFNIRHSQGQSWVLLPFATLCLQEMQPSHRVHHQGRDMWIITSPRRLLTLKECKHYTPYSTPVICGTPGKISESCDMLSRKDRHQSERTQIWSEWTTVAMNKWAVRSHNTSSGLRKESVCVLRQGNISYDNVLLLLWLMRARHKRQEHVSRSSISPAFISKPFITSLNKKTPPENNSPGSMILQHNNDLTIKENLYLEGSRVMWTMDDLGM